MKRVIMSIVLLASTAVAEGQDRVQQGPAPAAPSDSQEAASPPPPVLLVVSEQQLVRLGPDPGARCPGEPPQGVSEVNFTPGNPRTIIGGLAFRF